MESEILCKEWPRFHIHKAAFLINKNILLILSSVGSYLFCYSHLLLVGIQLYYYRTRFRVCFIKKLIRFKYYNIICAIWCSHKKSEGLFHSPFNNCLQYNFAWVILTKYGNPIIKSLLYAVLVSSNLLQLNHSWQKLSIKISLLLIFISY